MKPMTEQEARAALKKAMPWARFIDTQECQHLKQERWSIRAYKAKSGSSAFGCAGANVGIAGYAPTLRAAVAKAIRAWKATQKRRPAQKKGGRK